MKIDSTRIILAGGVALPLTFVGAASASASTGNPVDDAIASLESGQSYVAPGVDGSDLAVFDGTAVGVVALPADALSTLPINQVANMVYQGVADQYDTVIVVNADSTGSGVTFAVAPSEISAEVWPILPAGANDPVSALADESSELIALTSTTETVEVGEPAPALDGGAIAITGGGVLLGVAAVFAAYKFYSNRKHQNRNQVKAITTKAIRSSSMRNNMEKFAELTKIHGDRNLGTAETMRSILSHLNDLFARLEKKGVGTAKEMAEVNYVNILEKLNGTLGDDYYLDIVKAPKLWDKANERTREVERALEAVDAEVLNNIRQVNASKDLDFQIALESLLASADKPNASDMIR